LAADLGHLAKASAVKLVIDAAAIPRSAPLRALWGDDGAAIIRAATCGDDYQIAFTAAPAREAEIIAAAASHLVTVSRIGMVAAGAGVALTFAGKEVPVPHPGYRHF